MSFIRPDSRPKSILTLSQKSSERTIDADLDKSPQSIGKQESCAALLGRHGGPTSTTRDERQIVIVPGGLTKPSFASHNAVALQQLGSPIST